MRKIFKKVKDAVKKHTLVENIMIATGITTTIVTVCIIVGTNIKSNERLNAAGEEILEKLSNMDKKWKDIDESVFTKIAPMVKDMLRDEGVDEAMLNLYMEYLFPNAETLQTKCMS